MGDSEKIWIIFLEQFGGKKRERERQLEINKIVYEN